MTDMAYMGICPKCGGMTFSADDTTDADERALLARAVMEGIKAGEHVEHVLAIHAKMCRWCDCAVAAYEVELIGWQMRRIREAANE